VNYWHADWLRFALIQGSYAFLSTLALQIFTLRLRQRLGALLAADIATWIIACLLAILIPFSLQAMAGNPATIKSIAPGAIASMVYVFLLLRTTQAAKAAP
jgi:hypothetical protein